MPKARMTALDVGAMVKSVAPSVTKLRVANVYDISSKVYVLKLSEGEIKRHLILEAGVRFHLSDWKRDKQSIPSAFTMRLRKFLKTKRLASIRQLGYDRVIDIQCGYDENAVHLIIEFYSKGNVVLTDHDYIVKATWRQFKGSATDNSQVKDTTLSVRVNSRYPIDHYTDLDRFYVGNWLNQTTNQLVPPEQIWQILSQTTSKSITFQDAISKLFPSAHPALVTEYIQHKLGYDPKESFNSDDSNNQFNEEKAQRLSHVLTELNILFKSFHTTQLPDTNMTTAVLGYSHVSHDSQSGAEKVEDFNPILLHGRTDWTVKEFNTFHECVDTYFTQLELSKLIKAENVLTMELDDKVEKIRRDQNERVQKLQIERDLAERQAGCVEFHIDFASKALEMMQRVVSSGSDWQEIESIVKEQRRLNHPIAAYIKSLNLLKNRFTLLLADKVHGDAFYVQDQTQNEMAEDSQMIPIELVIDETIFANIERLHGLKKAAQLKYEKTQEAADRVVKKAAFVADKEREKRQLTVESRPALVKLRKRYWFEKFFWFISSNRFLVVAGRDAQQNDLLYKKYLRKNDLFVHADVQGAATCIIRIPTGGGIVPEKTIEEAGIMSICRSKAWKVKILTTAFWVHAHQVSKTPQPGEYISTGGFIIRGKRNPIRVKKLEMAVTAMFCLGDEDSIARHTTQKTNQSSGDEPNTPETDQKCTQEESVSHDILVENAPTDHQWSRWSGGMTGAADDEQEAEVSSVQSRNDDSSTPMSQQNGSNLPEREEAQSTGSYLHLNSYEVPPTPANAIHVVFEEDPPKVYHIENSPENDDYSDSDGLTHGITEVKPKIGKYFDSRPDSADELPPPTDYDGRTAPKDLLAKRTPETASVAALLDGSPDLVDKDDDDDDEVRDQKESKDWELLPSDSTPSKTIDRPETPLVTVADPSKSKSIGKVKEVPKDKRTRRKLKLMKTKYGEQSDSERELALKLIGASKLKVELDVDKKPVNSTKDVRYTRPLFTPTQVVDRNIAGEASDEELDGEEKIGIMNDQQLDELVGNPMDEDTLLFAIPMCAPWSAVEKNMYKGKLLPGGGKKGQAVQLIQRSFIEMSPKESLQRQLIKGITADELGLCIVANPVVQMNMATKLQKQDKKVKKAFNKALKEAKEIS